ncbi:low temperature requirement protein A [Alkalibacillus sp. S2W]|uniref:low temperature requirement protein A n=1 Tax=Alkalibacillus sp. S2W TaxID=3386553 RepID=UPI00398D478E
MQKKEVSISELFFDLIFVYVLASIAQTVESISLGILSLEGLGKHLMLFLVFFAIWVYRTLLVNRYFDKTWYQYLFVFIDMFLIILLSQSINSNFQETFTPFVLLSSALFMSTAVQYGIVYLKYNDSAVKKLSITYGFGLVLSSVIAIISIFLDANVNFWVYFVAILTVSVFPLFFTNVSRRQPVYFDHLQERLCLFMILLFGEGIVGVINNLSEQAISYTNIGHFTIIVLLFVIYGWHYKVGTKDYVETTGFGICYTHLILIFSLNMVILLTGHILHGSHIDSLMSIAILLSIFVYSLMIVLDNHIYGHVKMMQPLIGLILLFVITGFALFMVGSVNLIISIIMMYIVLNMALMFYPIKHKILLQYF